MKNDAADTADSQKNNDTGKTETPTADASIVIGDGNSEVVDFGTVISGQEDSIQAQYVTVTNTGNTTLNFTDISPEHFMVQDISNPMEQNSSQQLWIVPRAGIAAGEYDDTITYTSEEGVEVSFEAKMTVEAAKDDQIRQQMIRIKVMKLRRTVQQILRMMRTLQMAEIMEVPQQKLHWQ